MQGKKTHEQTIRTLERKPQVPDIRRTKADLEQAGETHRLRKPRRNVRQSEFQISGGGMHQESRDHNKHNDPGQSGHKPQQPTPEQEKQ